jgi:asparagine synthase (glutamine-hydrolysing)
MSSRTDLTRHDDWVIRWSIQDEVQPEMLGSAVSQKGTRSVNDTFAFFDGYLLDKETLRQTLNLPPATSEASIIEAAYRRWDLSLCTFLRGGFVFSVWDNQQHRLLVARDAIGLRPCFYFWNGRRCIISGSIDALLTQPEVSSQFNRAVVAEYLLGASTEPQKVETFYSQIKRIPPASFMSITRNELRVIRYYDPVPPGFDWANDGELAQFTPLLEQAIARCLSVGADSIALSGGFDSVGIAVLAAEQLKGKRLPHALSLRFNGVCDEGKIQIDVARALGIPQLVRTLEECLGGQVALAASLKMSKTSPGPVLSIWQAFYSALFRLAPANVRYLLMGTGGDDLLTVDPRYGADCLRSLHLGKLIAFVRNCQRTSPFSGAMVAKTVLWDNAIKAETTALLSRTIHRSSPKGHEWLRRQYHKRKTRVIYDPRLAKILEERRTRVGTTEPKSREGSYASAIRALLQSPVLMQELEQGFVWARAMGFTLLFPYFDQDLVGLMLRAHPEHLLTGGKAKAPLRRLVSERLPNVVLPSKKVDFSRQVQDLLRPHCEQEWQKMGRGKILYDLGVADTKLSDSIIKEYAAGRSDNHRMVWRLLSTEAWLRGRMERVNFTGTL